MDTVTTERPAPWWVKNRAPWHGDIFGHMALGPDDPGEQRVQAIREGMLLRYAGGRRKVSMAKAQLITRAYQESEGQHPAIRRALAMRRVFREIPLGLLPGQLLMGTASSGPHIVDLNPEFLRVPVQNLLDVEAGATPLDGMEQRYIFEEEDQRIFLEEIWPYWRTHGRAAHVIAEMRDHYPDAWHYALYGDCYEAQILLGGALHHTVQDYASILAKGLEGIKAEMREQIAGLDALSPGGMQTFERRSLYQAMLIAADGMIDYARRNADYAEQLAAAETDAQRRAELLEMARICRKVPAQSAESWWEALQALHFLRAGTAMVEGGDSHSVGRLDLYLLPYWQRDVDPGRLSPQQAQELLELLFLKWNETALLGQTEINFGGNNNDKINIGGTDEYGRDVTNELSYRLLEAHAHVHLNDPNLAVRLHRNTPDAFLRQSLEVLRLGGGLPILISDEAIVPALVSRCGVELRDARHYADTGCQENVVDPNITGADANGRTNAGWFNIPKPLELALWNGVNPLNGRQVGPQSGDPRDFATMDEFFAAVRRQMEHAVAMNVTLNNVSDFVYQRYFPCVFHDLMHPGPRRTGIDIQAGGCKYNWTGTLAVGTANAGDSLAAIDQLLYEKSEVGWEQLLAALRANWEGHAGLRQRLIAAPKYGADDEYADGWTARMLGLLYDAFERHHTPRGGRFVVGLISMGSYVTLGRKLAATPDGRTSRERLADSVSPSHYAPAAGPTAAHRSVARAIDPLRTPNGVTFNQRFNATAIGGPRELSKWADLVRAYVDAGGMEVQYTVVDAEAMRRAQQHPEEYRDLIVRVGGYSAIFVELSKELQDSIIARAQQEF
ncbi:MAG: pyruvate formate lyase family protein [Chloroflexota bacterium]